MSNNFKYSDVEVGKRRPPGRHNISCEKAPVRRMKLPDGQGTMVMLTAAKFA